MSDVANRPSGGPADVPFVVFEATRALLRLRTGADARRVAENLVLGLGGCLVPASTEGTSVLPIDISFGDGAPRLPSATAGSPARALLDRHLSPFLLDARQVLEVSERTDRLAESASTDVLTGLPNRRMLERALGRLGPRDTVIMMDLDHFKAVNDAFGHAAGDDVLRAFGMVLRDTVRGGEVVGRFGGEEFTVVLGASADADAFLERLRGEWLSHRPRPVTFSAGVAASVGDPDDTVALADKALYEAKAAGRDRWAWATSRPAPGRPPRSYVEPYLVDAVAGNRQPAVRLALDLLDNRMPCEAVVVDLLAAAQHEVGERWYRNELTAADEHLATGVSAAALDALAAESRAAVGEGLTLVTCAEGDWHSLAAQMFGESLRACGVGVTVLGGSTPAEDVAAFLGRSGADSLAISCSLPVFFPGVVRLVDVAHRQGIPVLVGGRAFGPGPRRAVHLGADAWASSADDAAAVLAGWRANRPKVAARPTPVDPAALRLSEQAGPLGRAAYDLLVAGREPSADGSLEAITRLHEDLVLTVQFLAAAILVDDDSVASDFVRWLRDLLANVGIPADILPAALGALVPVVDPVHRDAGRLLDATLQELLELSS